MRIKNRLAKLEKQMRRSFCCPQCRYSIRQPCIYEEYPDGTRRLVEGTPPAACPACGKVPSGKGVSEVVVVRPVGT